MRYMTMISVMYLWTVMTMAQKFTLETVSDEAGHIQPQEGWTQKYIYPGYCYKAIDGMITNFHLPKSSLLMLVSAFAGRENVMHAYEVAVEEKYRFFSFGDAMFIR